MKSIYLNYSKYLFLTFLIYSLYILTNLPDFNVTYTELTLGLILPYLPVWLSFYIAKKFDSDLTGSPLNILTLSVPAFITIVEAYFISIHSLVSNGNGSGLIWAFGSGTLIFFVAYGVSLILTVFVNINNKQIKAM